MALRSNIFRYRKKRVGGVQTSPIWPELTLKTVHFKLLLGTKERKRTLKAPKGTFRQSNRHFCLLQQACSTQHTKPCWKAVPTFSGGHKRFVERRTCLQVFRIKTVEFPVEENQKDWVPMGGAEDQKGSRIVRTKTRVRSCSPLTVH